MLSKRLIKRAKPKNSIFFLCDIQEVFRDLTFNMSMVSHSAKTLCKASEILEIPMVVTEHKPRAFGHILEEIKEVIPKKQATWYEKTRFSMVTDEVEEYLEENEARKTIVLFGIETHVCIQQTTLDLLEKGYDVHLIADGVSSQRQHDRNVALERLVNAGACLTTTESIIFELLGDSNHPKFKECLPLFKAERPLVAYPLL